MNEYDLIDILTNKLNSAFSEEKKEDIRIHPDALAELTFVFGNRNDLLGEFSKYITVDGYYDSEQYEERVFNKEWVKFTLRKIRDSNRMNFMIHGLIKDSDQVDECIERLLRAMEILAQRNGGQYRFVDTREIMHSGPFDNPRHDCVIKNVVDRFEDGVIKKNENAYRLRVLIPRFIASDMLSSEFQENRN